MAREIIYVNRDGESEAVRETERERCGEGNRELKSSTS